MRCETLLMVSVDQLRKLDVAKQAGYLVGMAAAWAAYTGLPLSPASRIVRAQVIALHWPLLVIRDCRHSNALYWPSDRDRLRVASAPLAL